MLMLFHLAHFATPSDPRKDEIWGGKRYSRMRPIGPSGRESSPNPAWSPLVLRWSFLRMDRFCLRDEVAAARGVSILRYGFCLGDGVNLCGLLCGPTWLTASVNACCGLGILGFPSSLFLILRKVGGSGVIIGI